MTLSTIAALLTESCRTIPETRAAVCTDLRSGTVVASEVAGEAPDREASAAEAVTRAASVLFANGWHGALDRLWGGHAGQHDSGEEIILLEADRCLIFLRSGAPPAYAIGFETSRAPDVGLTIARMRTVKARFDEALREL